MPISQEKLNAIVNAIHSIPEFTGVIVGLYDDNMCSIASMGSTVALPYRELAVIFEVVEDADDDAQSINVPLTPTDVPKAPADVTNRSKVWSELRGAGLSCSFAVISGVGVLGGAAGEVPSAGTSTFLVIVAWAGFAASSVQCLNGIVRTAEAIRNPDSDSLARWDQNRIYTVSFLVVDVIGVAAGLASLPAGVKNLMGVLQRRGGLLTVEELAKLGRDAKAKAIQDALLKARQNAESAKELDEALKDALSAKTMRRVAAGNTVITARNANTISKVISEETGRRLSRAILDVLASTGSPIASGMSSEAVGSASGSINALGGQIIHVVGLDT